MNKKYLAIGIIVVAAVALGWNLIHKNSAQNQQTDNIPYPLPTRTEDLQTKVGETTQGNTDVAITPLQIVEDSRCPANANCIWAGRVVLKARVAEGGESKEYEFTNGEHTNTDFGEITLIDVKPAKKAGENLKPEDYQFTFHIER